MKKLIYLSTLIICLLSSCLPWDFGRVDFVQVITGGLQSVDFLGARVEGSIAGLNEGTVSQYGHVWAPGVEEPDLNNPDHGRTDFGERTSEGSFISKLPNLQLNTEYRFRTYARYEGEIVYGEVKSFETLDLIFSARVLDGVNTTAKVLQANFDGPSIPVSGNVELRLPISKHGFCWSAVNEFPTVITDSSINLGPLNEYGEFDGELSGLMEETNYYLRAFVVIEGFDTLYSRETAFFHTFPAPAGWKRVADFPGVPREDPFSFVLNGKAYVGGGRNRKPATIGEDESLFFSDYYVFHPLTNWSILGELPGNPDNGHYINVGNIAAVLRDTAYLTLNAEQEFFRFTGDGTWVKLGELSEVSSGKRGFALEGDAYFFNSQGDLKRYDLFLADNAGWSKIAELPDNHGNLKGWFPLKDHDKAYFIFTNRSIWIFDPTLLPDPWTLSQDAYPNFLGTVGLFAFSSSDRVFILEKQTSQRALWEYIPTASSGARWKRMPDFPSYQNPEIVFTIDDKFYLGSFFSPELSDMSTHEVYTPEMWQFTPPN